MVKIRDRCFAGHVYDLQTLSGFIVAEGIICSNCRCIPEAVLEDDDIEELKEAGAERKSRTELRREKAVAEGRPVARWREDEPFTPKTLAQHIMDLGHWEEGNLSRAIMTSEGLTFNPTPAQKFSKGIPEDTAKALTNADIFPPGTVLSDGTNEIVIEDSSQIGPIDLTNRHSWVALMEGAEDLTVISLGKKP